jgi:hypothetical protein
MAVIEEKGDTWMTPLLEYLKSLFRKSFLEPWLRCVGPSQANYEIIEIHEGSCSMHSGPWAIVAKAIRSGYYWPYLFFKGFVYQPLVGGTSFRVLGDGRRVTASDFYGQALIPSLLTT